MAKTELAQRVIALRKRVELTQDRLAELAGLDRVDVNKVENGSNDATTVRVRDGLARAFGASRDDMADYIEGRIDLAEFVDRVEKRKTGPRAIAASAASARPEYQDALTEAARRWPHIPPSAWDATRAMLIPGPMRVTPELLLDLATIALKHMP